MPISASLFSDFVSGKQDPSHYFRSKYSGPVAYDRPIFRSKASGPVIPNQTCNRPDERHRHLSFVTSLLTDLVHGQYCRNVIRVVWMHHSDALTAINRAIFKVIAEGITGTAFIQVVDQLNDTLVRIENAMIKQIAPAVANCTCDPDIARIYDHMGHDITDEVDTAWKSVYGLNLSNKPLDNLVDRSSIKNVNLDIVRTAQGDMVDHPFGFGSNRVPQWMRNQFIRGALRRAPRVIDLTVPPPLADEEIEVDYQSGDPDDNNSSNLESIEKFDWSTLEKLINKPPVNKCMDDVLENIEVEIDYHSDFEKKPEFSTDINSVSDEFTDFDGKKVKVYKTELPKSYVANFVEPETQDELCSFTPQVVGAFSLAKDPQAYSIRLGGKAHSKMELISRAYKYLTSDFLVKLAVRAPLGVTGKFKVVSLDAESMGQYGKDLPTVSVGEVMSRKGEIWDISAQPEFVVHVPYNSRATMLTNEDVFAGLAIANFAPLVTPDVVSLPLSCVISVVPVNTKFYMKRKISHSGEVQRLPISTPTTKHIVSAPPYGGTIALSDVVTTGNPAEIEIHALNPDEYIGSVLSVDPTGKVKVQTVSLSANLFGRDIYARRATNQTTVDTASVLIIQDPYEVVLQSEEVEVEYQGEQLGTEEIPVNRAQYQENYGQTGNRVQAPTGESVVDVPVEEKIFVPIKTSNITPPATKDDPLFKFAIHPRNFGLTGNTGTYASSHASLEAERFVYFGPKVTKTSHYCTLKFTSVANAYSNARLLIAAVPFGEKAPKNASEASQYPRCYHVLHGGETEFQVPWQSQLPIEYTTGSVAPSTVYVWLLENATVTGQGTPQLTMWVSADGLQYSVPRVPTSLTPLPSP